MLIYESSSFDFNELRNLAEKGYYQKKTFFKIISYLKLKLINDNKIKEVEDWLLNIYETNCKEAFVIGGGEIYKWAMSIADKIYLTRVHTQLEADTFFPVINKEEWELISNEDFSADEKHHYAYSFQQWKKK